MRNQTSTDSATEVVVGVVFNRLGQVLVSQRDYPEEFAGKWEFPGGKIEVDETIHQALQRELMEEINIDSLLSEPLISITHQYPNGRVLLHVRKVVEYDGIPEGKEGQKIRWTAVDRLRDIEFLDANEPILNAVRLPHCYLITNAAQYGCSYTLERLEDLLNERNCMVQVREKGMTGRPFREFAQKVIAICHARGAPVVVNASYEIARDLGFDGVHLSSARLRESAVRPESSRIWIGASCHSEQEIRAAERLGADFTVLSPVLSTGSHPSAPPFGWERFRKCCSTSRIPVYALGGLGFDDAAKARELGGQGVAMISAAWQS